MSKFFGGDEYEFEDTDYEYSDNEADVVSEEEAEERSATPAGMRIDIDFGDFSDVEFSDEERVVVSAHERKTKAATDAADALRSHVEKAEWESAVDALKKLGDTMDAARKFVRKDGVPLQYLQAMYILEIEVEKAFRDKAALKSMAKRDARSVTALRQKLKKLKDFAKERAAFAENPQIERPVQQEEEESEEEPVRDDFTFSSTDEEASEEEKQDEEAESDAGADFDWGSDHEEEEHIGEGFDWASDEEAAEWDMDAASDDDEQAAPQKEAQARQTIASLGAQLLERMKQRSFWVKKDKSAEQKAAAERKKKEREEKRRLRAAERKKQLEAKEKAKEAAEAAKKKAGLSPKAIREKLATIVRQRGLTGKADVTTVVKELERLSKHVPTEEPVLLTRVQLALVGAILDISSNRTTALPTKLWTRAYALLVKVVNFLRDNIGTVQLVEANEAISDLTAEEQEAAGVAERKELASVIEGVPAIKPAEKEKEDEEEAPVNETRIAGNLLGYVLLLKQEWYRSLQLMSAHSAADYEERQADDEKVVALCELARAYYQEVHGTTPPEGDKPLDTLQQQARLASEILSFACVHFDADVAKRVVEHRALAAAHPTRPKPLLVLGGEDKDGDVPAAQARVNRLVRFVLQNGSESLKLRAVLCRVYYDALHGDFFAARDLMLMSKAPYKVESTDANTQILFNRAQAQLGLAAFRIGRLGDALKILGELFGESELSKYQARNKQQMNPMARARKLLGQGIQVSRYWEDRDLKRERQERLRVLPVHMHLNVDMLECAHLLAALVLDVPEKAHADAALDDKLQRQSCRSQVFRKHMERFESQVFRGPPDSARAQVFTAALAMRDGDLPECLEMLRTLSLWQQLADTYLVASDELEKELLMRVRESALATYLYAYGAQYKSLGTALLCEMFELSEQVLRRVVTRLIAERKLQGRWDAPTGTVVMRAARANRLQHAALLFADRLHQLHEQNERVLNPGYEHTQSHGGKRYGGARDNQRYERRTGGRQSRQQRRH